MKPTHNPRTPAQAARSARMDRKRAAKFDDDRARDHQDRSNPMTKHLLDEAATLEQRADELRRQADVFTDLVELQSKLGRDPSERPAPREPRHHSPQFLQRATTMAPRGADDDFDE